jgi:predicted Zn-dependent peptidase
MRRLHQEVYGKHPYALPVTGIDQTVREFTAKGLESFYQSWRDAGPWVIAVAGGVPADIIQKKLGKVFNRFRRKVRVGHFGSVSGDLAKLGIPLKPRRQQEQAHLALGAPVRSGAIPTELPSMS